MTTLPYLPFARPTLDPAMTSAVRDVCVLYSSHAADDPRIGTYVTTATRNAAADAHRAVPALEALVDEVEVARDVDVGRGSGFGKVGGADLAGVRFSADADEA